MHPSYSRLAVSRLFKWFGEMRLRNWCQLPSPPRNWGSYRKPLTVGYVELFSYTVIPHSDWGVISHSQLGVGALTVGMNWILGLRYLSQFVSLTKCSLPMEKAFCFLNGTPQKNSRSTPQKFNMERMEPEKMISKRNLLFQGLIFRFHVKLHGCTITNSTMTLLKIHLTRLSEKIIKIVIISHQWWPNL